MHFVSRGKQGEAGGERVGLEGERRRGGEGEGDDGRKGGVK